DKKAPELPANELRARRFLDQNIDDVVAIQRSGLPHKSFHAEILRKGSEAKLLRCHVDPVAGKCSRRFANVLLAVISNADGEKLHQFARPVFVWMLPEALLQIEINHHRRV